MREFSDFEKKAIRIIINNKPDSLEIQNFQTVVTNLLSGINAGININPIGKQITINYSMDNPDEFTIINKVTDLLVSVQTLCEYLESQYLIRLYNDNLNVESLQNKERRYSISKEINDIRINEFYCTHWTDLFCVSDELKTLSKNHFKTQEKLDFEEQMNDAQHKHEESMFEAKKQTKYTRRAFYVAIAAFIVSLCSPIFSKYFNNDELIRKEIRSVRTQTPKLINQQIKNDTLRVNLIKKSHNHE